MSRGRGRVLSVRLGEITHNMLDSSNSGHRCCSVALLAQSFRATRVDQIPKPFSQLRLRCGIHRNETQIQGDLNVLVQAPSLWV